MAGRFKRQDKQKKSVVRPSYACAHEQFIHKASVIAAKKLFSIYPHILSKKMNTYYKGLKFTPSSKESNVKRLLLKNFDEFARKLACKFSFDTWENSKFNPFRTSTGYKPDPACGALENYIDETKLEISSLLIKQYQDNLTSRERAALTSLKNNRHIVI